MQLAITFSKDVLRLPKRFEILEQQAEIKGAELTKIIQKNEIASGQIENLLSKVFVGGIGQFQLFLGESGSGKTTFLRTLPNFFKGIEVKAFNSQDSYDDILVGIQKMEPVPGKKIFIIDDRDNPEIDPDELKLFFEKLRMLFRKKAGAVVLIWPITDKKACQVIGEIAWEVGRDSVCPVEGAVYFFEGLPKDQYYEVADLTVKSLNNGEALETFGISKGEAKKITLDSNTIGDFYSRIEQRAFSINEASWKILEQKSKPKIWIVLAGNDMAEVDRTVRALTQGIDNEVDIARLLAYLDDAGNTSAYLNDWRTRRNDAGFLFRFLDVRLFSISPGLVLSSARVYGTDEVKSGLKKKSDARSNCHSLIRKSDIYTALVSKSDTSKRTETKTTDETQYEYLRLQQNAKSQDKDLNRTIAAALEKTLEEDGYEANVICEKQELVGTSLKPDIQIVVRQNETICLEITWRTTGAGVPNEISGKQNTLSPGHIQKYVLEKTMEYVKELGV